MTTRRLSRFAFVAAVVVVGAAFVLLGGCGDDDTRTRGSTTVTQQRPSSTDPPVTTTSQPTGPDLAAAGEVWADAWVVAAAPEATVEDLAGFTSPEVADRLIATLQRPNEAQRTVVNTPFVSEADDTEDAADEVEVLRVDDCLLLKPPVAEGPANWYSGVVEVDETATDGFRVTALEPEVLTGCVPASVSDEAIAGYEDHWDAVVEYSAPPDPNHPLVAHVTTGEYFTLLTEVLAEDAELGQELRGRPETHPEVVEYQSAGELVILDCAAADPEYGLYDIATGERIERDDAPVPVDGQRDIRSAVMVYEDGRWKVSDRQGQINVDCEFAPTPEGLVVVGEGGAQR